MSGSGWRFKRFECLCIRVNSNFVKENWQLVKKKLMCIISNGVYPTISRSR